jgi:hypothetical protein
MSSIGYLGRFFFKQPALTGKALQKKILQIKKKKKKIIKKKSQMNQK